MSLYVFYGLLAGFWLASIVACVLAIRWSCLAVRTRFLAAVILSLSALGIAYLGITRFHFSSTTTVNGQVEWRFDSRWLFIVSLVLGAFALGYTIWKKRRSADVS
jgi:TctA family transporter